MRLSIMVTRYNEPDELVEKNLNALKLQTAKEIEVLFLDQIDSKKLSDLCDEFSNKFIKFRYIRIPAKSLNFARNEALRLAESQYVAYCDNDALPSVNWAEEIIK